MPGNRAKKKLTLLPDKFTSITNYLNSKGREIGPKGNRLFRLINALV